MNGKADLHLSGGSACVEVGMLGDRRVPESRME